MKLMPIPIRFLLPIRPDLGRTSVRAGLLACLPVFALLAAGPVHSATLTVCPSGCDFTAIQPAVDSASSGDTVRVFGGVYPGPVVITDKSLVLQGEGASQTVIDGGKANPMNLTPDSWVVKLNCSQHIGITIQGVTITNGGSAHVGGDLVSKGCGLRLKDSAVINSEGLGIDHSGGRLHIEDSVISGNEDVGIGLGAGTGSLIHSTVSNNSGRFGGGISIGESGTLRIHRSTISNNQPIGTQPGGISNSGKLVVTQSVITNNRGLPTGGGIENDGIATLSHSLIANNEAAVFGGGILNSGKLTLIRSTVLGNKASDGGGVFNEGGTVSQTDTLIINNNPNDCVGC